MRIFKNKALFLLFIMMGVLSRPSAGNCLAPAAFCDKDLFSISLMDIKSVKELVLQKDESLFKFFCAEGSIDLVTFAMMQLASEKDMLDKAVLVGNVLGKRLNIERDEHENNNQRLLIEKTMYEWFFLAGPDRLRDIAVKMIRYVNEHSLNRRDHPGNLMIVKLIAGLLVKKQFVAHAGYVMIEFNTKIPVNNYLEPDEIELEVDIMEKLSRSHNDDALQMIPILVRRLVKHIFVIGNRPYSRSIESIKRMCLNLINKGKPFDAADRLFSITDFVDKTPDSDRLISSLIASIKREAGNNADADTFEIAFFLKKGLACPDSANNQEIKQIILSAATSL